MALSTASLKAVDGLSLTAGGVLSTEAGTEQAILSTHGGVILAAGDGISNAGAFSAEGGDLAITSGGFISNSGLRSEKGRGGKEFVSTFRSRGWHVHKTKNDIQKQT